MPSRGVYNKQIEIKCIDCGGKVLTHTNRRTRCSSCQDEHIRKTTNEARNRRRKSNGAVSKANGSDTENGVI